MIVRRSFEGEGGCDVNVDINRMSLIKIINWE